MNIGLAIVALGDFFFANEKNVRMYFYSNSTVILRVSTKYSARKNTVSFYLSNI